MIFINIAVYCIAISVEPDLVQIRFGNLPDPVKQSQRPANWYSDALTRASGHLE